MSSETEESSEEEALPDNAIDEALKDKDKKDDDDEDDEEEIMCDDHHKLIFIEEFKPYAVKEYTCSICKLVKNIAEGYYKCNNCFK